MNGFDEELERPIGGNYGLMDQQEALRFIHQNAEVGFQERREVAYKSHFTSICIIQALAPELC